MRVFLSWSFLVYGIFFFDKVTLLIRFKCEILLWVSKNSFRFLCQKFEISLARLVSDFSGKKRGIAGYCFVLLPPLHRVSNECVSGHCGYRCIKHRGGGRREEVSLILRGNWSLPTVHMGYTPYMG